MFSTKRLKKKSQSVDIATHGYSPNLAAGPQASLLSRASPPVARTTTFAVQENNATNSQRFGPRCGELQRCYTIDTGQKKTPEKKDGRRMSFQRPKGTVEYSVELRDTLNSIALKFDTTPNELVQLNKLFSRAVVPGQVLYVPDPEYVSSVGSSPSLSPISPLSPSFSSADLEKVTNSDGASQPPTEGPRQASLSLRPARVVSSTSEEEEALTERFLKINCKYITEGKGAVSGVLLVTPNNIMFDPLRTDPLVQQRGCEEYGIMCPLEEVMSAAMHREITDSKIRESVPPDLEQPSSEQDVCHPKRISSSSADGTQPRSVGSGAGIQASLSEDVFTEPDLSPIREELLGSDEPLHDEPAGASGESVPAAVTATAAAAAEPAGRRESQGPGDNPDSRTARPPSTAGTEQRGAERAPSVGTPAGRDPGDGAESSPASDLQGPAPELSAQEDPGKGKLVREGTGESETDVEELRKMWKSHTMQQAKEQRENVQHTHKEGTPASLEQAAEGPRPAEGPAMLVEKRRPQAHKFLCLRVGKPMKKTFISNASASMQQYAQRDRKHEYWFAVPQERSDHLYVFFIQWSPDMFGEGLGGLGREPGFMVVKKNEESESGEEPPDADVTKEWEVVSLAEYHRRIDALNSEDLRALCKRLQISTKEEVNSTHGTSIKTDLEPETFRPNLSEPSDLLLPDQIEKLAKNLPPRTIGYPWTLAFGTSKHGMSIKTLYRAMQGQDTPVLLVIKDSDGGIFGALASEPFKVSDGFYGTGETFLFSFYPEFEVFKWTGDNMFFIKGDMDSLAFGGGGGEFGLWLDGDLYHGRSHSCKTFGNPMLSRKEDFYVQDIEIWSFE
ncbi:oxidation resistance protein 1a isoform X1 [Anguilla anguilla]|uniref:oxidation resistance protein 1a isoform X1 n=1 Tax=Anguilla anguilla TaxID=7936 RepID=UPI0015B1734C|nr:oxidation resistance protein 1a isoform X1 [Anguilla anguilla]